MSLENYLYKTLAAYFMDRLNGFRFSNLSKSFESLWNPPEVILSFYSQLAVLFRWFVDPPVHSVRLILLRLFEEIITTRSRRMEDRRWMEQAPNSDIPIHLHSPLHGDGWWWATVTVQVQYCTPQPIAHGFEYLCPREHQMPNDVSSSIEIPLFRWVNTTPDL